MSHEEARGLLAIWARIDSDYVVEYRKWQNCQHMTERVTIPGFYSGSRYQGSLEDNYFLMMYETDDSKVMNSKSYLHAINNATSWTREALSHYHDTIRAIYRLICSYGEKPSTDAPYILAVKFDCESTAGINAIHPYQEKYMPDMCAARDIYRGRLYEVDFEVSNIKTSERKIHGAGPGRERYLAIFETASLDIIQSGSWKTAQMPDDRAAVEKIGKLENTSQELFWLDFTMHAPR
jgi:hypothetical protein